MNLEQLKQRGETFADWINNYSFNPAESISAAMSGNPLPKDPRLSSYKEWVGEVYNFVFTNEDYDAENKKVKAVCGAKSVNVNNYELLMNILESYNTSATPIPNNEGKLIELLSKLHQHINKDKITNEKELQVFMEPILATHFTNVRREEPVPSCLGAGSVIDFLLADDKIGIEVKVALSKSLNKRELGEQICADIIKYKKHPDCEKLYFYIYDPDNRIDSKDAITIDAENKSEKNYAIKVIFKP